MPYRRKRKVGLSKRRRNMYMLKSSSGPSTRIQGRALLPTYNGMYRFKQTVDKSTISNLVVANFYAYSFLLNDLDQSSTLTALFDQYKIEKIVMKFIPREVEMGTAGAVSSATPGYIYSVIDYDDATAFTTLVQAREFGTCRTHNIVKGNTFTITVKPHVALATYSGAFTSFANRGNQWIDVASPSVQHYGVKIAIPAAGGATANTIVYDVVADYYVCFKNVR